MKKQIIAIDCDGVLLFGDYPWNRSPKSLPKNVARAKTWSDVRRYFDA